MPRYFLAFTIVLFEFLDLGLETSRNDKIMYIVWSGFFGHRHENSTFLEKDRGSLWEGIH